MAWTHSRISISSSTTMIFFAKLCIHALPMSGGCFTYMRHASLQQRRPLPLFLPHSISQLPANRFAGCVSHVCKRRPGKFVPQISLAFVCTHAIHTPIFPQGVVFNNAYRCTCRLGGGLSSRSRVHYPGGTVLR